MRSKLLTYETRLIGHEQPGLWMLAMLRHCLRSKCFPLMIDYWGFFPSKGNISKFFFSLLIDINTLASTFLPASFPYSQKIELNFRRFSTLNSTSKSEPDIEKEKKNWYSFFCHIKESNFLHTLLIFLSLQSTRCCTLFHQATITISHGSSIKHLSFATTKVSW